MAESGKEPVVLESATAVASGERTGTGFEGIVCPSCAAMYAVKPFAWDHAWLCPCGALIRADALECPGSEARTMEGRGPRTIMMHRTAEPSAVPPTLPPRASTESVDEAKRGMLEGALGTPRTVAGDARSETPAAASPRTFGNYEIVREIARGGMGVVYLARQKGLGREVALKMLLGGENALDDQVKRFLREAESAAKLSHPNIVPVYDVGFVDDRHYFAMEFIRGRSLAQEMEMESNGRLPPRKALRIALDSARALGFAHDNGIVHRDVKPGNIMLEDGFDDSRGSASEGESAGALSGKGRVMLADFGLAREISGENALTVSGATLGTPAYMSPEQADGDVRNVGPASDVYSLGAVMYEMLTGSPPFSGSSVGQVLFAVIAQDPVPPRKLLPSLHRDVETIILKAMSKSAAKRYPNASEMAEDLRRFLDGEAISARPAGKAEKALKYAGRHKAAIASVVSVIALAIAAAAATLSDASSRRHETSASIIGRISSGYESLAFGDHSAAEMRFEEALALSREPGELSGALLAVRLARYIHQARNLIAAKDWENAGIMLEHAARIAPEDPELARLVRLKDGTATLTVQSAFEGARAWFVPFVSGVRLDELPLQVVMERAKDGFDELGPLPSGPADRPFGDGWVVHSSDESGLTSRFVSLDRNEDERLTFSRLRVGGAGALKTISEALSRAGPGTEIEVEPGEYDECVSVRADGIVVRAASGGRPVIRWSGGGPAVRVSDCAGFRLEGFDIVAGKEGCVSLENCTGAALAGNDVKCAGGSAILARNCRELLLTGNTISGGEPAGVQCENSGPVLVAGNRVFGNGEVGLFFRGGDALLSSNVIVGNRGYGAYSRESRGFSAETNLLEGNPMGGIEVALDTGRVSIAGNLVIGPGLDKAGNGSKGISAMSCKGRGAFSRNTIVKYGMGIMYSMASGIDCTDNIVAMNSVGIYVHSAGRVDFNCHYANAYFGSWVEKIARNIDEMRRHYNPNNEPRMPMSFEADPLFADPDSGDFSLRPGSPCAGTASDGGDIGAPAGEVAKLAVNRFDRRQWASGHAGSVLKAAAAEALRTDRISDAVFACALGLALFPDDDELEDIMESARAALGTGKQPVR